MFFADFTEKGKILSQQNSKIIKALEIQLHLNIGW